MGDDTRIKFWYDLLCGNNVLKDSFPSVFWIACEKEVPVANFMEIAGDMVQWNVSFARVAQDWEVNSFEEFFRLIIVISSKPSRH